MEPCQRLATFLVALDRWMRREASSALGGHQRSLRSSADSSGNRRMSLPPVCKVQHSGS